MVNYIPLNCSANRKEYSDKIQNVLGNLFHYTKDVNAHVLFDFIAPTSSLGFFDCIMFIDIPYAKGNYYRNQDKVYLNSLAVGIRRFKEPEVIDVDDKCLYTEDGSWEYGLEMESDRATLRDYVYRNIPSVKHFDISIVYSIEAPNCNKKYTGDFIVVNELMHLNTIINNAINQTKSEKAQGTSNIVYNLNSHQDWSPFISEFLNKSEEHTRHGVLTKKKVEALTKPETGRLMQQIYNSVGKKLCIVGGKAGTGKTLALMRVMYNEVRKGDDAPKHNCRLLTYNNMLVADIKQMMKQVGEFTPTKASISTLHKFFHDIYVKSPVRALHMDVEHIDKIFSLCLSRSVKVNSIIKQYVLDNALDEFPDVSDAVSEYQDKIQKSEAREVKDYVKFLKKIQKPKVEELSEYAQNYVVYKKNIFLENYHRQQFLNCYDDILKELYLVFHNIDEFVEKYGLCVEYSINELRDSEKFREKYQKVYNQFRTSAEEKLEEEDLTPEELLPLLDVDKTILDSEVHEFYNQLTDDEKKDMLKIDLKKIKRKVNWSKYILVDEAQDCQIYEKALLFELNGSDNTVIATGGKDQLIRRAEENNWSKLFGQNIDTEKITLRSVSKRQKGNIVDFLNAFANAFDLDTQLNVPDEIIGKGRVILDCRNIGKQVPNDQLVALHKSGEDYGCSNFENMMFLLPRKGYTNVQSGEGYDVTIDENRTVRINEASTSRNLSMILPEKLRPIDGTINDKRKFLNDVGQDNTRCVLYDSCRGLEAWNVMCMDFDTFYYEKISSVEAEEYGTANGGGLFDNMTEFFKKRYAALWCYMAMTRAMDTLYIKLSNPYNDFATKLINAARTIPHVEILEGVYTDQK